jgi:hypothetical protein
MRNSCKVIASDIISTHSYQPAGPCPDLAQPIHDHCTARPCRPIDGLDANAQVKVRDLVKIVVD